jgi:Tse2 ADP-ribosyltransferase toxins
MGVLFGGSWTQIPFQRNSLSNSVADIAESTERFSQKLNKMITIERDLRVVVGDKGDPEVLPGGGTSLHDASGWFPAKDFWIPKGTVYCSEEIYIRRDSKEKTSPHNDKVKGYHYQLEPKTRMTVAAFKGALDNMARAAVVQQCKLAKTES